MSKDRTPIHADPKLTDTWLADKGFTLGTNAWYNSIRDGSGRFDGYCLGIEPSLETVMVKTVAEAEIAIKWAQRWAAHGMKPSMWAAPPPIAPEER